MNLSKLRQEATRLLRRNGHGFKKLVLLHTAITAGVSLLLLVVNNLFQYIGPEGGLSNFDTQIMLSTIQTMLQLFSIILTPFWGAGLIYCAMRVAEGENNTYGNLAEGFRRWGPVTSSLFFRVLIYFFTATACSFASSLFLAFLPLPNSMYQEFTAFLEAPSLPVSGNIKIFLVIYLMIYGAGLCVLLFPLLYFHRLVLYRIMDDEPSGGFRAVLHSRILMKGHRKNLFRLDLSFWWFYMLDLVISFLFMGDLILSGLRISLPIGPELASWLFPIAALLLRLVLYCCAKPKLAVSYALFYQYVFDESLKDPEPPQPKRMPWKY